MKKTILTACLFSVLSVSLPAFASENNIKMAMFSESSRDYNIPLSASNVKDISYIVTMLGFGSLIKVMKNTSAIKKAGERVDNVHPFRFVECIFTRDELIVGAHNIKERSWAWKEFAGGIKKSLGEEYKKKNLKPEHIVDFAKNLGIEPTTINGYLQQGRWDDFINTILILKHRKSGEPNRYNI